MNSSHNPARCPGCNKLLSKVSSLKIKMLSTVKLIALLGFYFHMATHADDGVQMSKTHESCHKAMRDRHQVDPFYFPRHLVCHTILSNKERWIFEKTVFVPPNTLEYACYSFPSLTFNSSGKNLLPDCQTLLKIATYSNHVYEIPDYPIVPIKDDIYLHPESLSELATYALYNGGGNLVEIFFHGMIYQKIWNTYQLSNSVYAFPMMMLGMVWNSLEAYKHSLYINIHRSEFSFWEFVLELFSNCIEISLGTPDIFDALSFWPKTFRGKIEAMKEIAFFGLIWMNCMIASPARTPNPGYDENCPDPASTPSNIRCSKQIEEMHVLLDQ
ncbi:hypothetical protein [Endozoicomonas sp. 2B-B]